MTEPVGVPPWVAETVAVKVTCWLRVLGFCVTTSPVLVVSMTNSENDASLLPSKLLSPL